MGAFVEKKYYIDYCENNEVMEQIEALEKEIEKLKSKIIKEGERKLLPELKKLLPDIEDVEIYLVKVQIEKTVEDFMLAILTINEEKYSLVFENYCEYIYPEDELKIINDKIFDDWFEEDLVENIKRILNSKIFRNFREIEIIH